MPGHDPDFDWDALRAMWIEHADRVVAMMADEHPDETFYVLVFVLDEEIYGPLLAMQSLEGAGIKAKKLPGRIDDPQWSPYEWGEHEQIDPPDPDEENIRMYQAFQAFLKRGSREEWSLSHVRHDDVVVEAARVVAKRAQDREGAFARLRMTDDFVVFAIEHEVHFPFERARRSIDEAVLERLFAKDLAEARERARIAALPVAERVAYLVSRLGKDGGVVSSGVAHEQLAAIGAAAVPALASKLTAPKIGWEAAMVLAKMGSPGADAATGALRDVLASRHDGAHLWAACALGRLGCLDELAALAIVPKKAYHAVSGLKKGRPAAYVHLGALLDREEADLTKLITDALAPGSATYDVTASDFEAIAAQVESKHAAIRADVAIALRGPNLGSWDAPRAVPLLVGLLGDRDADVRRLAALSLGQLGALAKPALPRLRELARDRVAAVANTAASALEEIEKLEQGTS